jgi:hypothetical protein
MLKNRDCRWFRNFLTAEDVCPIHAGSKQQEKTMKEFGKLLKALKNTDAGEKLAMMAGQGKVEKEVLSEIMFRGNKAFANLDFYLEEKHMDLTVRAREEKGKGVLCNWVEAKMCYSDCLVRKLFGKAKQDEYLNAMTKDIEKQVKKLKTMPERDREARLTSMLIVVHHKQDAQQRKYFCNRNGYGEAEIEAAAVAYVKNDIADRLGRTLKEHVCIPLCADCQLHVFVFSN